MEPLKREFLDLLDRDLEFRYAVAGYLGLSEILKRLDALVEEQAKLREEQIRLGEEQIRLREEQIRLREEQTKIWSEIAGIREEQKKIWEEIKALREEQIELRKEQTRIWEEIRALREGQIRLEKRVESLESAMISGFGELSKFAGLTFEEFVRKFLTASLRRLGEIPKEAELSRSLVNGEEINLFLEEPLIVGEATGYVESANEILKLLRKAEVVKVKYSREPRKILVALTARMEAAKEMRKIAEERGVELIIGKIVY
ncbi:MAG: hypothetical protein QXU95_01630 [Candidatus Bathyarchaeia archaeon]